MSNVALGLLAKHRRGPDRDVTAGETPAPRPVEVRGLRPCAQSPPVLERNIRCADSEFPLVAGSTCERAPKAARPAKKLMLNRLFACVRCRALLLQAQQVKK